MGNGGLPEAGPWVEAVKDIGLGNTVILILALGFAISLIFRGPAYILAVNELLKTIWKYRSEQKRVTQRVRGKHDNLNSALSARKRNGRGGKQ